MKRLALLLVFAASPAAADECDVLGARVASETGLRFYNRADRILYFIGAPPTNSVSISCPVTGARVSLTISSSDTASPSASFFEVAATLSRIAFGLPSKALQSDALLCQQRALEGAGGIAQVERPGRLVSCSLEKPSADPKRRPLGSFSLTVAKAR